MDRTAVLRRFTYVCSNQKACAITFTVEAQRRPEMAMCPACHATGEYLIARLAVHSPETEGRAIPILPHVPYPSKPNRPHSVWLKSVDDITLEMFVALCHDARLDSRMARTRIDAIRESYGLGSLSARIDASPDDVSRYTDLYVSMETA